MKRLICPLVPALVFLLTLVTATAQADSNDRDYEVVLETTMGDIHLLLFPEQSPETVANFLNYVDAGFYDGLVFHRVIPGFMAQTGGFDKELDQRQPEDSIQNESDNGLSNDRGTIAMARTQAPHSATSQFFINVVDNPSLNHQGARWGYAVFGEVTLGMSIIDEIVAVETHTMRTARGTMGDVPVEPIVIERAYRVGHKSDD